MKGFDTRAIHVANSKELHSSLYFPAYGSAAFEFENSGEIEAVFSGQKASFANKRAVKGVNYPGLKESKFCELASIQFRYSSCILTFELESKEACYAFMDSTKIKRRSTNLCDNKTVEYFKI